MDLEQICERCKGTGRIVISPASSSPYSIGCTSCMSSGKVPNEFGQQILDFIGKWGLADLQKQIEKLDLRIDRL